MRSPFGRRKVTVGAALPAVTTGPGTISVGQTEGLVIYLRRDRVVDPSNPTLAELAAGVAGGSTYAVPDPAYDWVPFVVRGLGIYDVPPLPSLVYDTLPSLSGASLVVGADLVIDLGVVNLPGATTAVETLTLDDMSKLSEVVALGDDQIWNTGGESAGAIEVVVTATLGFQSIRETLYALLLAAPTGPLRFTGAMWTLTQEPTAGANQAIVTLIEFPDNGGSAITALQYSLDGTTFLALPASSLGALGLGPRVIPVPAGQPASVFIRAVNVIDNGTPSSSKPITPTYLDTIVPDIHSVVPGVLSGVVLPIAASLTEASTVHLVVVPQAEGVPSAQQVQGGLGADGQAAEFATSVAFTGTADFPVAIPDGIAIPAAMIYVVAVDSPAGNRGAVDLLAGPVDVNTRAAPTLVSSSPADNAVSVGVNTSIVLTFSEAMAFGTGTIVLRQNNGGWSDVTTFNVATNQGTGPGQVSIEGPQVTLHLATPMANSREHAVRIAPGALVGLFGNAFAGVANDTDRSFTTIAAAVTALVDLNPSLADPGLASWITTSGTIGTGGSGTITINREAAPKDFPNMGSFSHRLMIDHVTANAYFYHGDAALYSGARAIIPGDTYDFDVALAYRMGGTATPITFGVEWINGAGGVISTPPSFYFGTPANNVASGIVADGTFALVAPAAAVYPRLRARLANWAGVNNELHLYRFRARHA